MASSKSEGSRFPTTTAAAFARLKSFAFASRQGKPEITFPPPSWEIDKLAIDDSNGKGRDNPEPPSKTSSEPGKGAGLTDAGGSAEAPVDALEPSEPLTFAQRIRELIDLLPVPGTPAASRLSTTDATTEAQILKARDGSPGPSVPPGVDEELVSMLSSEEVMNGDEGGETGGRKERQSIWGILSAMRPKSRDKETDTQQAAPVDSDDAGGDLMVYAPLEPTNDSQVELAETRPSPSEESSGSQHEGPPKRKAEWVPSPTQISVYTTWWGFRLYLPPPIMNKLDSVSLTTTAQAAMVTSALKWLLVKLPTSFVPIQFRPHLLLLKRLSPVIGYIGVFVAWSWGRIKAHDTGNGVVLTATWLLPVALIPAPWDAGEIVMPAPQPGSESKLGGAGKG